MLFLHQAKAIHYNILGQTFTYDGEDRRLDKMSVEKHPMQGMTEIIFTGETTYPKLRGVHNYIIPGEIIQVVPAIDGLLIICVGVGTYEGDRNSYVFTNLEVGAQKLLAEMLLDG